MASVASDSTTRLWSRLIPGVLVAYLLAVVALEAYGRIQLTQAVTLLVAPVLAWVAVQTPAALILLFVALPPGVLAALPRVTIGPLTFLFAACLAAFMVLRGIAYRGLVASALPVAVLVAGAFMNFNLIRPTPLSAASEFRRVMLFYLVLLVLAYVIGRTGELNLSHLGTALLVSAGVSGLIFLWQVNFLPWTYAQAPAELEPGGLFFRTHFGYMTALGFGVALARMMSREHGDVRGWDLVLLAYFSMLVTFSFTRGAWLVALLLVTIVPLRTGRKGLWLILPVLALVATGVPLIQERLFSDISAGLQRSLESGDFATGRWGLWREMLARAVDGLPWGHGYGYVWNLKPQSLFAEGTPFTRPENPFVYVHNDFLYWTLELGLLGLAAMVAFWGRLIAALRRLRDTMSYETLLFGGVILTMFVASMVDNALAIRPVSERFFIVAGITLALASRAKDTTPDETVSV